MRNPRLLLLVIITVASTVCAQTPPPVPCEIVTPVFDTQKQVVLANAPDGKPYPVFRLAVTSPLIDRVRGVLQKSFAQQVLKLDRYARNFVLAKGKGTAAAQTFLTAPMYLLMSTEEGGFARHGFWLEDQAGNRQLILAGYVDLVVRDDSVETGDLEEIFSHELAHLILRTLAGDLSSGWSHKMHQSMTITDYPTAFDEGYAEHFQPLVRDATTNTYIRQLAKGAGSNDLNLMWISSVDQQLRTDGVKRNVFIHAKALPASALDAKPDLYAVYVDGETSTNFITSEVRSGQQMMASEGVIATLFYRLVNSEKLRTHYREAAFYAPFLPAGTPADSMKSAVSPFENVNLKLFAAMRNMNIVGTPPMIALVNSYAKLFPDEAQNISGIFIATTWGATASQELASGLERAAIAGQRGDIDSIRQNSRTIFPRLSQVVQDVAAGKTPVDANLGPELWIVNSQFKIARAVWVQDRTLPLTINLNTATEPELMTVPGIDLTLARSIVTARKQVAFFKSLVDLRSLVPASVFARLEQMAQEMARESKYQRE